MLRPARILVVDDDPAITTLLAEILTDEGYRAQLAQDAPSALAAVVVEAPDLVIADLLMREMSGLELLHAIRAWGHADVPVVLMTAAADRGADLTIHSAAACLLKPFDLDDLLSCIEQTLRPQLEQREALA